MKKTCTLFLLIFWFGSSQAQNFFITLLPHRGAPKAMFQTPDKGFIVAYNAFDSLGDYGYAMLIKYDQYGDSVTTYDISEGFTIKSFIYDVNYLDSNTIFILMLQDSLNAFVYTFNQHLNLKKKIKSSFKLQSLYRFKLNDITFGALNSKTFFLTDSLFTLTDTVLLPNLVFQHYYRSKFGQNIFTTGADNPLFPSTINYHIYNDSLQVVRNRNYKDIDHIPIAVKDGWLMYYKGLFRLNGNLDSIWHKPPSTYKISGWREQYMTDLKLMPDGGFVMVGNLENSLYNTVFLTRTDSLGNVIFNKFIPLYGDHVYNVEPTFDGGYMMLVSGYPDTAGRDLIYLLKTNNDGTIGLDDAKLNKKETFKLYPNPARESCKIDFPKPFSGILMLQDLSGKIVQQRQIINTQNVEFDLSLLSRGTYLISAIGKDGSYQTQKLLKN